MTETQLDLGWTSKQFGEAQKRRLLTRAAMAAHAANLPRRLGAGARALALDRRRSRRVGWAAIQAWETWGGNRETLTLGRELIGYREGFGVLRPGVVALARTRGATVQWHDYVVATRAELELIASEGERHAINLATTAEANAIKHRIEQEIKHLEYAIRDDTRADDYDD